jgi:hypothetical protein
MRQSLIAVLLMLGIADAAPVRTIHVFVALCDNDHQGIVPVPARLGNGDDPASNLYWGAAYGVKSYLGRSTRWQRVSCVQKVSPAVLERCVFRHRGDSVYLVADAWRGERIDSSIARFFDAASGNAADTIASAGAGVRLPVAGSADLLVYVGHDGLMDFSLQQVPSHRDGRLRDALVLCCMGKQFFGSDLVACGARPLLLTTGLMAPEAYILEAAAEGWIAGEGAAAIAERSARAYDTYQKCGLSAAQRLFAGTR